MHYGPKVQPTSKQIIECISGFVRLLISIGLGFNLTNSFVFRTVMFAMIMIFKVSIVALSMLLYLV